MLVYLFVYLFTVRDNVAQYGCELHGVCLFICLFVCLQLETTLRSTDESYMVPVNVRSTKDKRVVCSYDVPLVSVRIRDSLSDVVPQPPWVYPE